MMKNRWIHTFVITLSVLLLAACQTKGPTPKEGSAVSPAGDAQAGSAQPGATGQDPHAGMAAKNDPHAGMGMGMGKAPATDTNAGQPDSSGMIDVGAVSFKLPTKWEAQQPKSSMRRAQLSASGSAGPAELIVYFFGPQGAGSADANIERWVGQFSNADGSPVSDAKQSKAKVSTFEVTKVEVAGQYAGGMAAAGQAQAVQAGQRLLAAIVDTDGGPYYFKFLGPDATVIEQRGGFEEVIASVVSSP